MTDSLPAYKHIGQKQDHQTVKHSAGGAVVGVWHQISVKHLGRYASEATFRWNRKPDSVLDRMVAMVRNGEGRLLSYAFLTRKAAPA